MMHSLGMVPPISTPQTPPQSPGITDVEVPHALAQYGTNTLLSFSQIHFLNNTVAPLNALQRQIIKKYLATKRRKREARQRSLAEARQQSQRRGNVAKAGTSCVVDKPDASAARIVEEGPVNHLFGSSTPKRPQLITRSEKNQLKAKKNKGGSKLIPSTSVSTGADDSRACLPNAVMSFVFNEMKSDSLHCQLISNKPVEGDMSVSNIIGTLRNQGLDLEQVTPNYCQKGRSPEYFLMKEEACRLVLTVKLRSSNNDSWGHFMGWDGHIIHDNPHSCKVELESDRTKKGSKATFRKLFPEKKFPHADVSAVWQLVHYS